MLKKEKGENMRIRLVIQLTAMKYLSKTNKMWLVVYQNREEKNASDTERIFIDGRHTCSKFQTRLIFANNNEISGVETT